MKTLNAYSPGIQVIFNLTCACVHLTTKRENYVPDFPTLVSCLSSKEKCNFPSSTSPTTFISSTILSTFSFFVQLESSCLLFFWLLYFSISMIFSQKKEHFPINGKYIYLKFTTILYARKHFHREFNNFLHPPPTPDSNLSMQTELM